MRLRNIRGSKDVIASCPFVVQEPESCRGRWAEVFGNENPIHIEVGMGKTEIKNLFFIRMDARQLPEVFAEGEVDRIYLNFSDPWPKDRHAKRRLTSHEFLARYEKILKKDGTLEFKTDNKDLFDFSLEEMENAEGWELTAFTYDLHHDVVLSEGNVMTEYEEKFSSIGNPICKMEARFL